MARTPRTSDEPSGTERPVVDGTDHAAMRARSEPIEVEDPNQIGEGAIGRPDGRAAPSEEDLSSKTDFEGLPDPTSRAAGDADGGFDPNDLDLAAGRDGRFPGDADLGEDPFGLDVDADALAAETHGGLPDLPGAGSSAADPFDDGLTTEVPDEYSLAGNEAGDGADDFIGAIGGGAGVAGTIMGLGEAGAAAATLGTAALPGTIVFTGSYAATRSLDKAFGVSDAFWEQVDELEEAERTGPTSGPEPEPDQSEGEPDTEPGQSEGAPATEPDTIANPTPARMARARASRTPVRRA